MIVFYYLSFINWKKNKFECDSNYTIPQFCSCCGVDFPILTVLELKF